MCQIIFVCVQDKKIESPEDVLDLHDINYIDWTDIRVPHVQEPTVPVEEERDSSRVILVKEHRTDIVISTDGSGNRSVSEPATEVQVPEVNGLIQEQDVQQPGVRIYHNGNKHSTCPILTCGESTKKLKHHCWQYHLPYIFKDHPLDQFEKEPGFQRLRGAAIQILALWIVGPRATVYDLVRYINSNNILSRNCTMMQRCQDQMRNLTAVMNWYPPAEDIYTMYPNSPAVIMQWRVLITLLSQLSSSRRAEFHRIGTGYVLPPRQQQQSPVKRKSEMSVNLPLPKSYKSSRPTEGRQMVTLSAGPVKSIHPQLKL
ncbi:unnamed protein product [Mytilus coruscus]|uniref:Uncharacterized protein n=1 Tax=Mytilus coruscus TaxID=42192 RepID=A0A6J8BIV2_MYTCO|nr:unnamed protein product [Mytilus coruscus]